MLLTKAEIALPDAIEVSGKWYKIKTDFRLWIRYFEILKTKPESFSVFDYLYIDDPPTDKGAGFEQLSAFACPVHKYPRIADDDKKGEIIDYEGDADYIYAAFLQQYGIDLIDVKKLHWHKFSALLRGLKDTKLNDIINIRLYENDTGKDTDYSKKMYKLRDAWEIYDDNEQDNDPALTDFLSRLK